MGKWALSNPSGLLFFAAALLLGLALTTLTTRLIGNACRDTARSPQSRPSLWRTYWLLFVPLYTLHEACFAVSRHPQLTAGFGTEITVSTWIVLPLMLVIASALVWRAAGHCDVLAYRVIAKATTAVAVAASLQVLVVILLLAIAGFPES